MSNYIPRMKDVILDYLGKAQQTEKKIVDGRQIYQPEAMAKEEKRLREQLATVRKDAEAKIDAIARDWSREAENWGRLDGAKLTADAQLLQGQGVTPEQFDRLVERYQDNYTMLDQLRKYGESSNAYAAQQARNKGENSVILGGPYRLDNFPDPGAKMREVEAAQRMATQFLNVADGTGFSSDFDRNFARNAADKQFEAWGADPGQQPAATAQDFVDAWGFGK